MKKQARSIVRILLLFVLAVTPSVSQFRVTSTQQLPLPTDHAWGYPRFSPDGAKLYYTTQSYDGIWEYDLRLSSTRQLTADQGSGYGFAVSRDGRSIAYRRTFRGTTPLEKRQEVVAMHLRDGDTTVLGSGRVLSTPAAAEGTFAFLSGTEGVIYPQKPTGTAVIGIVEMKIALLIDGKKVLLDPLGSGSYIWPSLSPDRSLLVAFDMDRGAFVYDMRTASVLRVGKADGPTWTRDGKWIIGFAEKNDGYRVIGSELIVVAPDGKRAEALTSSPDLIELFPACSPTEDRVAFHSLDGRLWVLTYEVVH